MMLNSLKLKTFCLLICSILIFLFISCESSIETDVTASHESSMGVFQKFNPYRIPRDIVLLSSEDARQVAMNLEYEKALTKSTSFRQIESIYTIESGAGEALMYVINYDKQKGFTIISASKTFFPVLAEVDEGNLNTDCTHTGIDEFLDYYKNIILLSEESGLSENLRAEIASSWTRFEERIDIKADHPSTKASNENEALFWTQCNTWISGMEAQGYDVYALYCYPDEMSSDTFSVFCTQAQNNINPEFNYMDHSFLVVSHTGTNETVWPLFNLTWHQGSPFRDGLPDDVTLGCVPVAMGQIMWYYEWPDTYSWSLMPFNQGTTETQSLLADLHWDLNTSSIGGTSLNSIIPCFQSYDYQASLGNYDTNTTVSELNNGRPVLMLGTDYLYGGHAWVCTGQKNRDEDYVFDLYVPVSLAGSAKLVMRNVYSSSAEIIVPQSFYMNWGFVDGGNGWYIAPNVSIGQYNFSYNRKIIYQISPDQV